MRMAVSCKDPATALRIIHQNGGDIGKPLPSGETLLHHATHRACWLPMVALKELYYTYGITDVNCQDRFGWTPLHQSIDLSHAIMPSRCQDLQEIAQFLLDRGANPSLKGIATRYNHLRSADMDNVWITPYELSVLAGGGQSLALGEILDKAGYHTSVNIPQPIFFDAEACGSCRQCTLWRRKERATTVLEAKLGTGAQEESYRWLGTVAEDVYGWNDNERHIDT